MGHIRDIHGEFEKRGTRVVTILAEKQERIHEFLETNEYPYPVLSDAKRKVVKEYGVYVRANVDSINIARPANFVLDADGTILFQYMGNIQFDFPKDEDIFATLDSIKV